MSEQPTYLKLLRGIANAESDAHGYLSAWRDVTSDPDVRAVLTTVASREGEHGMAFAKRVVELGFEFERKEDPSLAEKMAVAASNCSDKEKAEYFGIPRTEEILSFFDTVVQGSLDRHPYRRVARALHRGGARHRAPHDALLRRALLP